MHRRETERTTRMNRDQLVGPMAPDPDQAITARLRVADIRAAQARDHAVTTPMQRRPSHEPPRPERKQTLRMGTPSPTASYALTSDARIQAPMMAIGSGVAHAAQPERKLQGPVLSFVVAAGLLIAFFALYACV